MNRSLLRNIRFYVLVSSLTLSLGLYLWVRLAIPAGGSLLTIRLTQLYALAAVIYLYFSLLIGPLVYVFRWIPFRGSMFKARRAIGVSAFYFGFLHAYLAFFDQLGGFEGLGYLSNTYLLAIGFSFSALVIMFFMTLTTFDRVIGKMGFTKWKFLHRFVYLAGVFILIHALMLGTHFAALSALIPKIFFVALSFLLILEANRIDAWFIRKFPSLPRIGVTRVALITALVVYVWKIFM